jgi:hypothetical protein
LKDSKIYLNKQLTSGPRILQPPDAALHLVVVIPCYNEPDLIRSLEALFICDRPGFSVETIIVINSPEGADDKVIKQNLETFCTASLWIDLHQDGKFRYYLINLPELPRKHAGVGLARKIGMDEAVRRFDSIDNPGGIIVSFDADSVCDRNYLLEIERHFKGFPKTNGCSVYFEHPIEGTDYPEEIYKGIVQYELHLRYLVNGLRFCSFPYSYHTVGSSFVVSAEAYVKQGGMNTRQAGEDFYFLHKVIPLGHFYEINTTRVIPSPRQSDRVPFGTGAALNKFIGSGCGEMLTYNFCLFENLKKLFSSTDEFFKAPDNTVKSIVNKMDIALKDFMEKNGYVAEIDEINRNSPNINTFRKRYFNWFNAFRIVKYLNYASELYFPKIPISSAIDSLFQELQIHEIPSGPVLKLKCIREIDRRKSIELD